MNEPNVDVSVIIPCYCCTDTISRAINSIAEQTWVPKEVILIDDASPDQTLDTLYKLQKQYTSGWIKVIDLKENNGPGTARNAGWLNASCSYLAFLDSDDTWHPRKIEIQYEWLCNHPDVILCSHHSEIMDRDSIFPTVEPDHIRYSIMNKLAILFRNPIATRCVMLKRDISFRFKEKKRYSEDYLLWLTIILSDGKAAMLGATLAYSHKENFDKRGLSGNLWKMQKGGWATHIELYRLNLVPLFALFILLPYTFLKYIRRLLLRISTLRISL